MESVSPASVPRPCWAAEKQRAKGFTDPPATNPLAIYPFKRADWFAKCFDRELAARKAPALGAVEAHFRSATPQKL